MNRTSTSPSSTSTSKRRVAPPGSAAPSHACACRPPAFHILALLLLAVLPACASTDEDRNGLARPWLNDPRMQQWEALEEFKRQANHRGQVPQMQEFIGCGTIFVWNHSLQGGPGGEFVHANFSYKNTSGLTHDWVRIWMEVKDPEGRVINRSEKMLIDPLGYAISPDQLWSDEIEVQTLGVHRQEGWTWQVGCEPVQMKVLRPEVAGGDLLRERSPFPPSATPRPFE